MKHVMDQTVHNARNALDAANKKLDRGRMSTDEARALMEIADRAHAIIDRHSRMDDEQYPYKNTNIGYRSDARGRARTTDDVNDLVNAAMDAVDRIIPHLDDKYNMDDDADARRGRPRRTRSGVGRWTNVRGHVRRMPRSDMDDRYDDDRYDDDRYSDDRYDDRYEVDDRRLPRRGRSGRFIRGDADDRYERTNDRYTDDERRMRTDRTDRITEDRMRTDDDRRTADDDRRNIGPRG